MTRIAVVTAASGARLAHLHRQRRFVREVAEAAPGLEVVRVEAWLDAEPPHDDGIPTVHVPPGPGGLRVGAGRNAAARRALAEDPALVVFLDVDCLPGPGLLEGYAAAAMTHPDALLAGPVTYLRSVQRPASAAELPAHARPHPARPMPEAGDVRVAGPGEYDLFWSLSFAATPATWARSGGFDEAFEGYGAEDTDYAWRARAGGIDLAWVGAADAYHQWHPAGSPPWRHLDDILRNGALFAERWGVWPMRGWLRAFEDAGAIEPDGAGGWRRV